MITRLAGSKRTLCLGHINRDRASAAATGKLAVCSPRTRCVQARLACEVAIARNDAHTLTIRSANHVNSVKWGVRECSNCRNIASRIRKHWSQASALQWLAARSAAGITPHNVDADRFPSLMYLAPACSGHRRQRCLSVRISVAELARTRCVNVGWHDLESTRERAA